MSVQSRSRITDIRSRPSVLVWMRSSFPGMSFSSIDGAARALSPVGYGMARAVAPDYAGLMRRLGRKYGNPSFFCAEDIASTVTLGNTFMPEHIVREPRLGAPFDLRTIDDGRWYQRHKDGGVSWADMLDELYEGLPDLSPDAADGITAATDFVFDQPMLEKTRFRVAVGPESLISLTVADIEPESNHPIRLGLHSGQAFIIFHNREQVTRVDRFEPAVSRSSKSERVPIRHQVGASSR